MPAQFPISSIIMKALEGTNSEEDFIIKTLINMSIIKLTRNPDSQRKLSDCVGHILNQIEDNIFEPEDAILITLSVCDSLFASLMDSQKFMQEIEPVVQTFRAQKAHNNKPKLTVIKGGKS
jgi:uncharacterized protein YrrD